MWPWMLESTHNQWAFVVLTVLFKGKDVDAEGRHGVEESKDSNGDKELSRWGVISHEEMLLSRVWFAGWSIKVYLMEPAKGARQGLN